VIKRSHVQEEGRQRELAKVVLPRLQSRMAAVSWLFLCTLLFACTSVHSSVVYNPEVWNQNVLLQVSNAPPKYFQESNYESNSDTWIEPMFPTVGYNVLLQCKGPGKTVDFTQERAGACSFSPNADNTFTYKEKQAGDRARLSNCYCYALEKFAGGWCYPGQGGGAGELQQDKMSCPDLAKRVIADGGLPATKEEALSGQPAVGHYVALMYRSSEGCGGGPRCMPDFHFLRKDSNGFWSQKLGEAPVTNLDRSGNTISNPEAVAKDGGYDQFCGYFKVVPNQMRVGTVKVPDGVSVGLNRWQSKGFKVQVTPLPYSALDGENYYAQQERLQQQQRGSQQQGGRKLLRGL